jgi:hypothetical protein
MKNRERKVYMTVDKTGNPVKFGNSRKYAWTSVRWVNYHLKPYRKTAQPKPFVVNGGMVKIIDLNNDTIENIPAYAFLIRYGNEDAFKAESKERIGFSFDPGILISEFLNLEL